ncbi:hypothetical protein ACQ4PT_034177 [Festuca glaucescens]
MNDGETAPPPASRRKAPYMSHELVSEILSRLPVESLVRFSLVCKTWRATISRDASFHRAHLRSQKPWLLISPHTQEEYWRDDDAPLPMDKVGLYRWEAHQEGTTAPLVHATDLSSDDPMHGFAHCDGLLLLPSDAAVHVLNPATRRTLTLPWSPGADPPRFHGSHQAFGLGYDTHSNTYKVARFFYRSVYACAIGGYHYTTGMEVFTIGTDRHWRETAMQPPYPVLARRTATFFKGSLVWTIDEHNLQDAAPGFLCFGLEDESFAVMPPPPCHPSLDYTVSSLAELQQELCLTCVGADNKSVEMWMCNNVNKPQWDRRYTIVSTFIPRTLCPIAAFDGEILFKEWLLRTSRYDLRTKAFKDVTRLEDLTYHNPSTGTVGYQTRVITYYDVILYVPSLIPTR